jgi:hypothetical protein
VGVGGRAVLPDTNLSEGRGPRTVEVIWVTIGSEKYYSMRRKVRVKEMILTQKDLITEPLSR